MWWFVIALLVAGVGMRLIHAATISSEDHSQASISTQNDTASADRNRRTPKEYMRRTDVIYRDEFMDAETETTALTLDSDGMPTGHLERERDRLVIVTDQGMVNPKSTRSHKLGIYSFLVRGTSYYKKTVTIGGHPTSRLDE